MLGIVWLGFYSVRYTGRGINCMLVSHVFVRVYACVAASMEGFGPFRAVVGRIDHRLRVIGIGGSLYLSFRGGNLGRLCLLHVGFLASFLRPPSVARRVDAWNSISVSCFFCYVRPNVCRLRRFFIQQSVLLDCPLRRVQRSVWFQFCGDRVSFVLAFGVNVGHSSAFFEDGDSVVRHDILCPRLYRGLANGVCWLNFYFKCNRELRVTRY